MTQESHAEAGPIEEKLQKIKSTNLSQPVYHSVMERMEQYNIFKGLEEE